MEVVEVITQELRVRCVHPEVEPLVAELRYDREDPYAVVVTVGDDGSARFEVARTTLVQAITRACGMGDAQAWPVVDEHGRSLVVLRLRSGDAEVVLELRTTQLDRFLGRTRALVPLGTESDHVDIDAAIDRLLGHVA